jgi:hypothetical protein
MKKLALILVSLCGLSAMANANYSDAGCGLGSVVMGKDGNQVLAATTNDSTYTQLFGITSGTSNCVDSGTVASARQVPVYIEVNRIALAKDAARGEGEVLAGLAQLMGCQQAPFGQALKSNYDNIFVKTGMQPSQIRDGIETMVQKNHSQACGA